ncbi:MAG: uncharacterized protein conserved in archaea [uncultured archaeon A07HR60]|nr:MAG: uncharacterized protein conserved in archaea [uncultured archaeon A07HR60]
MNSRAAWGVAFAVSLFVVVQLGALALVPTFFEQGYQPVNNPQDPTLSIAYIGAILVATVLMLAAFKYKFDQAVRYVIVGTSGMLSWYVFGALLPTLVAVPLAAGVSVALLLYPEWYIIDAAGVLMGAAAAGLFGITFGLLPALILLTALAVYDAISVYGTEHMLSLAEGVMDLKIPVILVIPLSLGYSLLSDDFSGAAGVHEDETDTAGVDTDDTNAAGVASDADTNPDVDEETDAPAESQTERDAFFIGLGDAVIPAVLVASAAFFSSAPLLGLPGIAVNGPALGAMVGTILGLLVLLRWVLRGEAHAGLPLLNGGAIGGYLIGSVIAGIPLAEAIGVAGLL